MKHFNWKHKVVKVATLGLVLLAGTGLAACGNTKQAANHNGQSNVTYSSASNRKLADLKYHSGKSAVVTLNHNHAQLSTHWSKDSVNYAKLDSRNRTSNANTGWLDKQNVANDSLRAKQTYKPVGYHQKFVNNAPVVNRGHEIAYSLSKGISKSGKYQPKNESGDQNNPQNLFTQTAFSNQELQTIYESKVRNALKSGQKVIYQVQPIFKGKDDMANGVHMQAKSTNGKLNFNVFLFNVQPGVGFNYRTGLSFHDPAMKVPTPAGAPHFHDNNSNQHNYHRSGHHFFKHYAEYRVARHVLYHHGHHLYHGHWGHSVHHF